MGFKLRSTEGVFAGLRSLCEPYYREYDHENYFHHNCDIYEKVVERAEMEYARLLKHCEKQRDELSGRNAAWVRLPENDDGEPIRPGDRCIDGDGDEIEVYKLTLMEVCGALEWRIWAKNGALYPEPSELVHVKSDSWAKIINDAMGLDPTRPDNDRRLRDLLDRCERLAGA